MELPLPELSRRPPRRSACTQSSVAVSADGSVGFCSMPRPTYAMQCAAHHELWPRAPRGSPIASVVLTDGEIDHTLGLLLLRENTTRFRCTPPRACPRCLARVAGLSCAFVVRRRRAARSKRVGPSLSPMAPATGSASAAPRRPVAGARRVTPGGRLLRRSTSPAAHGRALRCTLAYIPTVGAIDDATRRVAAGADPALRRDVLVGRRAQSRRRGSTDGARDGTPAGGGRVAAWSFCRGSTQSASSWYTSTTRIPSCVAARRSGPG